MRKGRLIWKGGKVEGISTAVEVGGQPVVSNKEGRGHYEEGTSRKLIKFGNWYLVVCNYWDVPRCLNSL